MVLLIYLLNHNIYFRVFKKIEMREKVRGQHETVISLPKS